METSDRLEAELTVDELSDGERVDKFVVEFSGLVSRSQLRQRDPRASVNGERVKLSHKVRTGDVVTISLATVTPPSIVAEKIDLSIMYEDDDVVVVNKPAGMVVHPAAGNWSGTLAQGLLSHLSDPDVLGRTLRPGIVHRLDKDTSGVIIAAKSTSSQEFLAGQFRDRSVTKEYLAIVRGQPPRSTGTVDLRIGRDPHNRKRFAVVSEGGKDASTEYRILQRHSAYCYLTVHPVTGRTHQIRVHLSAIGCPILGDPVYSRRDPAFPGAAMMLHAHRLRIRLPSGTGEQEFVAELPESFTQALLDLERVSTGETGSRRRL